MSILNAILWIIRPFSSGAWVLVHFLWQGAVLGLFAWLLRLHSAKLGPGSLCAIDGLSLPRRHPSCCHVVQRGCPAPSVESCKRITGCRRHHRDGLSCDGNIAPARGEGFVVEAHIEKPVEYDTTTSTPTPAAEFDLKSRLEAFLPWFVAFWFLGVFVLSLRMAGGWYVTKNSSPAVLHCVKTGYTALKASIPNWTSPERFAGLSRAGAACLR